MGAQNIWCQVGSWNFCLSLGAGAWWAGVYVQGLWFRGWGPGARSYDSWLCGVDRCCTVARHMGSSSAGRHLLELGLLYMMDDGGCGIVGNNLGSGKAGAPVHGKFTATLILISIHEAATVLCWTCASMCLHLSMSLQHAAFLPCVDTQVQLLACMVIPCCGHWNLNLIWRPDSLANNNVQWHCYHRCCIFCCVALVQPCHTGAAVLSWCLEPVQGLDILSGIM